MTRPSTSSSPSPSSSSAGSFRGPPSFRTWPRADLPTDSNTDYCSQSLSWNTYHRKNLYYYTCGLDINATWLRDQVLKLTPDTIGRFRDAYLNADGTRIYVVTRNGGPAANTRHISSPQYRVESKECVCLYCIVKHRIRKHPYYKNDAIVGTDTTYRIYTFGIPSIYQAQCMTRSSGKEPLTVEAKFANSERLLERGENPYKCSPEEIIEFMDIVAKVSASPLPMQGLFDNDTDWLSFFHKTYSQTVTAPSAATSPAVHVVAAVPVVAASITRAPVPTAVLLTTTPTTTFATTIPSISQISKNEEGRLCARPSCAATGTKRCSQCKRVWYCSILCQGEHWVHGHKSECH